MRGIIYLVLFYSISCKPNNKLSINKSSQEQSGKDSIFSPVFTAGSPHTIIYKTRANYNNLVPILLSKDKTEIISYPHPTDLIVGGRYSLPTILNKDYLLDNRGINKDVVFIKMTYEEYSKLLNAPSLKELYNLIIDKNPLIELWDCGNRYVFTDLQKQLNYLIDNKLLEAKCKAIK